MNFLFLILELVLRITHYLVHHRHELEYLAYKKPLREFTFLIASLLSGENFKFCENKLVKKYCNDPKNYDADDTAMGA